MYRISWVRCASILALDRFDGSAHPVKMPILMLPIILLNRYFVKFSDLRRTRYIHSCKITFNGLLRLKRINSLWVRRHEYSMRMLKEELELHLHLIRLLITV